MSPLAYGEIEAPTPERAASPAAGSPADEAGKGLRTAPRDALIAASTPDARLDRAFGVHRAGDRGRRELGVPDAAPTCDWPGSP
ncbi:MAG TPA: hypothetical protein VM677_22945 [Actinokineospora sp.]|nr:hypothetical protein [Actinokineospora sp.]